MHIDSNGVYRVINSRVTKLERYAKNIKHLKLSLAVAEKERDNLENYITKLLPSCPLLNGEYSVIYRLLDEPTLGVIPHQYQLSIIEEPDKFFIGAVMEHINGVWYAKNRQTGERYSMNFYPDMEMRYYYLQTSHQDLPLFRSQLDFESWEWVKWSDRTEDVAIPKT